jgi:hypothetical protein
MKSIVSLIPFSPVSLYVFVRHGWPLADYIGVCLYWRSLTDTVGLMDLWLFVSAAIQLFPRRFYYYGVNRSYVVVAAAAVVE